MPPIDIWTNNRSEIQRLIEEHLPQNSCLFGRVNNGKFRVFARDANTRTSLIDFLTERKYEYEFNSYTPSDEKMINVIIKGLDHIDDPEIIIENLTYEGFVPHKVQKRVTGYMRKNNIKSNLWHIVLLPNTDTKALFEIRVIENAIVKFEFLKKPEIIQCRRCQRLFHSASNCHLPYRCVKCVTSHEPGQCISNTNPNKFKPKCVNCKGNHTANDVKNCPYLQKALERKDEQKTNKQKGQNKQAANKKATTTNPGTSYADTLKNNTARGAPSNNTINNKGNTFEIFQGLAM